MTPLAQDSPPCSPLVGLLHAAKRCPQDNGPRLAVADWLESNGDLDRAELIRVQCRLAALPEPLRSRGKDWEREQELLAKNRERWLGNLASALTWRKRYSKKDLADLKFDRGLIYLDRIFGKSFREVRWDRLDVIDLAWAGGLQKLDGHQRRSPTQG